ncbi:NAD(P)H-dependent glycerol-3-phosphate dehydrogenase [Thiothrix subterranea]|uniref:Glycerol-3-phosphate dehydrogenase [NAD(P)+] n=1 Tax=Thiothrix subterranea TaxID=2735563 RepID=A0AA51MSJ3_9GAMM|nr:NAD(P)H-dependent glycerol-3-phosphate dehydrogenase [Thiothrix subterranea]MDQ5768590.1 NAD(P)H-dependent glycerol-3-phosphate dehydrogenase [Thiothrix subterranea]WML87526.1 NAD(P)H-dependent glycerol-3-phosphate dehydrogenase [Thiothrix subterranea]
MSERIQSIAVYGAGSWGTALALQLARNGLDVLLWDISPEHVENLNRQRENSHYLPGISFPDKLQCSHDLTAVAAFADYHLVVVPSHVFREMLQKLAPLLNADDAVLWATKGLELETGKLLHQVLEEELPQCHAYGVVSGPTFAAEVARGLPTAMTVAANQPVLAQAVATAFSAANYRAYISNDVLGVELGGAVKNVLAIAAGISDGLGFGANARVAIVTRGLAEIMRLGAKLGAQPETLMGLAGVGDLVLTCTDNQSRNRRLGLALGQGKSRDAAIAEIGQAVEGAKSALSIGKLAERAGVEMPICQQVYRILYEHLPPKQAVHELLSRDLKAEF